MKRLFGEITILVVIGVVLQLLFTHILYPAMGLPSGGPVPVRTLVLVLVITFFLRKTDESWKDYGFHWNQKAWLLIVAVIIIFSFRLLAVQPFNDWFRAYFQLPPNDYSFFAHIQGNVFALIVWLLIAWIAAGFGEEMIFRGYLMGRIAKTLGENKGAWIIAVVGQALIFGVGHSYAGWGAATATGIGALVSGGFFLIFKKSLWPLIIFHGLWDTLGIIIFFIEGAP